MWRKGGRGAVLHPPDHASTFSLPQCILPHRALSSPRTDTGLPPPAPRRHLPRLFPPGLCSGPRSHCPGVSGRVQHLRRRCGQAGEKRAGAGRMWWGGGRARGAVVGRACGVHPSPGLGSSWVEAGWKLRCAARAALSHAACPSPHFFLPLSPPLSSSQALRLRF